MKEHPLYLSEGLSDITQLRVLKNLDVVNADPNQWRVEYTGILDEHVRKPYKGRSGVRFTSDNPNLIKPLPIPSPYQVGAHLYLKEAWRIFSWWEGEPIRIQYKDGSKRDETIGDTFEYEEWAERMWIQSSDDCEKAGFKCDDYGEYQNVLEDALRWRSLITMPKGVARKWYEVTDVRVERVQDIGINDLGDCGYDVFNADVYKIYADKWNARYAKKGYGFDTNCWTWIYGLKELEKFSNWKGSE